VPLFRALHFSEQARDQICEHKQPIIALPMIACAVVLVGCTGVVIASHRPSELRTVTNRIIQNGRRTYATRSRSVPLHVFDVEYHGFIENPGTPLGLTMFGATLIDSDIEITSAAVVMHVSLESPRFASRVDRTRWIKAGRPALPSPDNTKTPIIFPYGQFSFLPEGRTLTYRQAFSLPPSPALLSQDITVYVQALTRRPPPPDIMLKEYGFLLATAPLSVAVRSAMWQAIYHLAGVHLCGLRTDLLGRRGLALCAATRLGKTALLVNAQRGVVLAVNEYLEQRSPLFPTVPPGTLLEADDFASENNGLATAYLAHLSIPR
jgi:hypothetical protein